jgi:formylglycine-generating enzyme required for sulfatase activity/serine/threonine protein kinase
MSEHPAPPEPAPATLPEQFGHYRILQKLGAGGMGAVYKAHDTKLDRPVALKVPHFPPGSGPEVLQRFLREARLAAKLRHPNICPVYEVGQINGIDYLAMALLPGKPLAELISPEKPMPPAQVVALVRTLALTLHEAHAAGVIHRDLKPGNIMIDPRSQPVIMDFGLAFSVQQGDARLTQSGVILGTPAYMPPEQINGDLKAQGPRCDVYSLGVILYQLLTGRLPFEGPVMAVLGQVLTQEPLPPSLVRADVDPGLSMICTNAMAKKPEDRFASMLQFAAALKGRQIDWRTEGKRRPPPSQPVGLFPDMPVPDTRTPQPAETPPVGGPAWPVRKRSSRARSQLLLWLALALAVALALVLGIVAYVATDRKTPATDAVAKSSAPAPAKPTPAARPGPSQELAKAEAEADREGQTHLIVQTLGAQAVAAAGAPLGSLMQFLIAPKVAEFDALGLDLCRAHQARQEAVQADAAARAAADWHEAERKAEQAEQAFHAGDMVGARRAWYAARLAYDNARQAAAVVVPVKAPADKEIENCVGMMLVLIPAGKFWMGSPEEEQERRADEGPRHEVEISKDFYLGKFEVTQEQYEKVMGKGTNPSWFSAGGGGKDKVAGMDTKDFPVEQVSWEEAKEFCKKLSEMEQEKAKGRKYDLPTEAEWEYACRAGTQTPFHFGSQLQGKEANCDGNNPYGTTDKGPYLERTCKVGSYPPNAFGLCDMHGNVWEWCQDWYDEKYYGSGSNKDPEGYFNGTGRVVRGASWRDLAGRCRAANRSRTVPGSRRHDVGFRVRLRLD